MRRLLDRWNLRTTLATIVLLSLSVHLTIFVLGKSMFREVLFVQPPLHTGLETAGALIAYIVAYMLIALDWRDVGTSFNTRIAAALIGMGTLDLAHALVNTGEVFVWFHSVATLIGGFLFSTVWLPERWVPSRRYHWPLAAGVLAVGLSFFSLSFPEYLPRMFDAGRFSTAAVLLNLVGGLFLWLAALRLLLTYLSTERIDDLIFCLHCTLFGAAAVTFMESNLWNVSWWGWHLLRFLAYSAALVFAFYSNWRDQVDLVERKESLERKVSDRTEQLRHSLEEKETLLKEIHHRVKNNLQVISSMLNLQSSRVDNESVRYEFERILNRIKSIALVHEFLYRSENLSELDFDEYVRELIEELKSLKPSDLDLTITVDLDETDFNLDTIVNCGLILNEAVTNCLQHAFRDRDRGEIIIRMRNRQGTHELTIEDDGCGLPDDLTPKESDSLGFELIQSIATTDLEGSFDVRGEGGTTVVVQFPDDGR